MAHVNGQHCYLSGHHVLRSSHRSVMALHPVLTILLRRCLNNTLETRSLSGHLVLQFVKKMSSLGKDLQF